MEVADHEPSVWFLLKEADTYYLDARVTRSAVEWSLLIELTAQEQREYHAMGKVFLHQLAARMDNFAEEYTTRDRTRQLGGEVARVIKEWRASGAFSR